MNNNNKLIFEMKEILNKKNKNKQGLMEKIMYGEMDEAIYPENLNDEQHYGNTSYEDDEPEYNTSVKSNYNYDGIENADKYASIDEKLKPTIDKIRLTTIQALGQIADYPQSETYNLLKKIWQIVDKSVDVEKKENNLKKN